MPTAELAPSGEDTDLLDAEGGPAPGSAEHLELPRFGLMVREAHDDDESALPSRLRHILCAGPLDAALAANPGLDRRLLDCARSVAANAYPADRTTSRQAARWIDHEARDLHHRALLAIYQQHMRLPHLGMSENQFHPLACTLMSVLEAPWERDMLARAHATHDLSSGALPEGAGAFVDWYRATAFSHPLYEHDVYAFLAQEATREQLQWFLRMESAGEAAFDDLLAMGQVGTRGEVKIEMARNFWDEMGNGRAHAVHTHMFHRLAEGLEITAPDAEDLPWQVLAGVNVMLWSCIPRRNAFRAQGVLGAVELLAPQRCTRLVHGAVRVGIEKKTMRYYGAHAIIDVGHAEGWLEHVLRPQVSELPASRAGMAEGLLVRADASLDYFDWTLERMRRLGA